MAWKTDEPCYIKFLELELDEPDSPARSALLQLRGAYFSLTPSKLRDCDAEKETELRQTAEKLRSDVLTIGGKLVDRYLPIIDKAVELGI